jgi:hypothetical protein
MMISKLSTVVGLTLLAAIGPMSQAQVPAAPATAAESTSYQAGWDVQVPANTRLEAIKMLYERRRVRLPARDLADQSPLPAWFRAYLRDNLPELPTSGRYQYPWVAAQILQWMLSHPDLNAAPPSTERSRRAARMVAVGGNINLTNFDEVTSEPFIAQDYNQPNFLIAAANNLTGSGRQKQFFSIDGGNNWTTTELPLAPGTAFHSDPALAFATDGTAWASTLGIDSMGTQLAVQVFKSDDHGATWTFVKTVSTGSNNDKEMMWIDNSPASAFKDNIYVTWDVPGRGMRFARSADKGRTWSSVMTLSDDSAIGAHLSSGPAGEVYVAWPDISSRELRIRKSMDGGASFGPVVTIAMTNSSYEISVPGMCQRKVLVYLSVGVDRSSGPRRGNAYAVWNDRDGTAADPGCAGTTLVSNSSVYFSASSDGGNTWSTPRVIHTDTPSTDQFNPWMDVDPDDGTVHVMFYDTRDDPGRRKTNIYYIASKDGGATWGNETKVSSETTDETASGAEAGNQYGDYSGLVAFRNVAFPAWTDRRATSSITKEQIFTARVDGNQRAAGDGEVSSINATGPTRSSALNVSSRDEQTSKSYPRAWDVKVPAGTKLDRLRQQLEREVSTLPEHDDEDGTPIPAWFRVYLRKRLKNMPTSGPYQYPRTARRILQQLLNNPNNVASP